MISRHEFTHSDVWHLFREQITQQIVKIQDDIKSAQTFAEVRYQVGWMEALEGMLELPDKLLRDESESPKEESIKIVPPPRRAGGIF